MRTAVPRAPLETEDKGRPQEERHGVAGQNTRTRSWARKVMPAVSELPTLHQGVATCDHGVALTRSRCRYTLKSVKGETSARNRHSMLSGSAPETDGFG